MNRSIATSREDERDASPGEREEALWCEVVRLRHVLSNVEKDNVLLREHIELLKARREPIRAARQSLSAAPVPACGNRLSTKQRADLAERFENYKRNATELAREFGVTVTTIHRLRRLYIKNGGTL